MRKKNKKRLDTYGLLCVYLVINNKGIKRK